MIVSTRFIILYTVLFKSQSLSLSLSWPPSLTLSLFSRRHQLFTQTQTSLHYYIRNHVDADVKFLC